eukprot:CAMPEP_0185765046 /NCGR_PEP_ID=MMETSP1174-20130828/25811_1 /TAXON_ID=35687 /ORGANISM="Dictyocha speculum, Strain CCMP1381" /LENGTH=42 /DNA_ID= /DNA_START= /DNA_END= /DNA_ORIENTATION=
MILGITVGELDGAFDVLGKLVGVFDGLPDGSLDGLPDGSLDG